MQRLQYPLAAGVQAVGAELRVVLHDVAQAGEAAVVQASATS